MQNACDALDLYVMQEAVGLLILRIYSVAFGTGAILVCPSPTCVLQLSSHMHAMYVEVSLCATCWVACCIPAGQVCRGLASARPCHGLPDSASPQQVETEWERVLSACRMLEGWVCRGLALGFVAALTLELTSSVAEGGQTDFHKSLRLYRAVAGASLLACAAVYVGAGLLCLGRLKRGALASVLRV